MLGINVPSTRAQSLDAFITLLVQELQAVDLPGGRGISFDFASQARNQWVGCCVATYFEKISSQGLYFSKHDK